MEENFYDNEETPEGIEMFMERPKNKKTGFFNKFIGFFKKLITFRWFESEELDITSDEAKRLSVAGYDDLYGSEKPSTPSPEKTEKNEEVEKTEDKSEEKSQEENKSSDEPQEENIPDESQQEVVEESSSEDSEKIEESEKQM